MSIDGVAAVRAALTRVDGAADRATRAAVAEGLAVMQRAAVAGASGRPGPNVVTGTLRRGIRMSPVRQVGDRRWAGEVGPTVVYSRWVERRYPFFAPALRKAKAAVPAIFKRAWARAGSAAK